MASRTEEHRVTIVDEVDLTQAILVVGRLAQSIGFNPVATAMLRTAVSELGRNILKYAVRGTIIAGIVEGLRSPGVEVVAVDRGPGIPDLELALRDHYSTSGTLGLGLPGVRRMMDEFEIVSAPGQGTSVTIRKWRP